MNNTYTGCSVFDKTNTTSTGFEILTGIDKYYITGLPKKEDLGIPDENE